jgi:hypothetical protein
MISLFTTCVLLLAVRPAAPAQEPTETVIRLHVPPRAAPRPALKYQLLPELAELDPGNPIQGYLRCFMEQQNFFYNKEAIDERERLREMPLKDLPVKEQRGYGGYALRQADEAARLANPDWQILLKLKKDGPHLLIPDVQSVRELAGALQVRFRLEIADRHFDEAVRTAQTMFAMSRHMAEHPTVIGDLVALAIAMISTSSLDEMIQQPGCPNLYWALTDLPRPLINLRQGLQGERAMLAPLFALVKETEPMTQHELARTLEKFRVLAEVGVGDVQARMRELRDKFFARVGNVAHVRAARQRLVEAGLDKDAVKDFPAMQVVLLDEKRAFEIQRDELMKTMGLPYWQGEEVLARVRKGQAKEDWLAASLLPPGAGPSLAKVRMAQVRLEQRLDLLRCVEALRLYAAGHGGRLPARLADVPVPVPLDPVNGKPFTYRLDGVTAHLRGAAPPGMESSAGFNVHYEVTIRK